MKCTEQPKDKLIKKIQQLQKELDNLRQQWYQESVIGSPLCWTTPIRETEEIKRQ
jgi:hypothetical protein